MTTATEPMKAKDYKSTVPPTWCMGCGDYGVLNAVLKSFADNSISIDDTVLVSGIGCSSRFPYFVKTYGMHTAHGRVLPVAAGLKMARPDIRVIAFGGDGDGFSIGGGHVPHVVRKNTDLTYILMDNSIYGLTKGQVSPTSEVGMVTTTTPYGAPDNPVNPLAYCLTYGATYVAQGYSSKSKQVQELVTGAIEHKGFAFVNIISPCPTFNKLNTFDSYKETLEEVPADHDTSDLNAALKIALRAKEGKTPIGLLYKENRPTLVDRLTDIRKKAGGDENYDLNKIINTYIP
ncbi:MAG: 2-oxoacid:ferredoxin oxidoreductase subunit beta [Nitrospinota bacterium]|nr:2-oxoacid:ferredoxin oxidoreductase subunit beta [Nitrospinota bacterium]MDH5677930.1 2-oxoacid:ferredoxin oxidoreductase subunit beta [Nitrospinota bacterium]MDH5756281.1 2-oxoacid:ferredoxin oxidoreductase subunit beta [Nitrospinota bacterium]